MRPTSLFFALALPVFAVFGAGCAPSTQYAQVGVDYRPSPSVTAQMPRLTGSALAYQDADVTTLTMAGGVYLGEIDLHAARGALQGGGTGGANLSGRASLEAASRGATHFELVGSDVGHVSDGSTVIVTPRATYVSPNERTEVVARFAMYRVDPMQWSNLPPRLQPSALEGTPAAATTVSSL